MWEEIKELLTCLVICIAVVLSIKYIAANIRLAAISNTKIESQTVLRLKQQNASDLVINQYMKGGY